MKTFAQMITAMMAVNGWNTERIHCIEEACSDPSFSTRDIAMLLYALTDASMDYIMPLIEAERQRSSDSHIVLKAEDHADIRRMFHEEIFLGCREIAACITGKTYDSAVIEERFYKCGFDDKFDMLASDLIREAYGITFASDGRE